jgi:hypothetical protein
MVCENIRKLTNVDFSLRLLQKGKSWQQHVKGSENFCENICVRREQMREGDWKYLLFFKKKNYFRENRKSLHGVFRENENSKTIFAKLQIFAKTKFRIVTKMKKDIFVSILIQIVNVVF